MLRRCIVKVVLSNEQQDSQRTDKTWTSESEPLRMTHMDYVKELSLLMEKVHKIGEKAIFNAW